jgi:hypothetical protein
MLNFLMTYHKNMLNYNILYFHIGKLILIIIWKITLIHITKIKKNFIIINYKRINF